MSPQKPSDTLVIPEQQIARLSELVKEYRCPDCKAWALYVKNTPRGLMVLCRKCAFAMPLARFAQQVMHYRVQDGVATVRVVDMFGDEKIVTVSPPAQD